MLLGRAVTRLMISGVYGVVIDCLHRSNSRIAPIWLGCVFLAIG